MESQQASDREGTRLKLLQQQFNYLMMYRGSGQIAASDALVICKNQWCEDYFQEHADFGCGQQGRKQVAEMLRVVLTSQGKLWTVGVHDPASLSPWLLLT